MPGVDVYYRESFHMSTEVADAIKDAVRDFGPLYFSTDSRKLGRADFSFKFHAPDAFDDLTNDVIVRIRLHHFEERLLKLNDDKAAELADFIAFVLAKSNFIYEMTMGAELMLAEIMWGSASTRS